MHLLFKAWKDYFQRNRTHFSHIAFTGHKELTTWDRDFITTSIQQFQRGESSEGLHLLKVARDYDQDYHEAIKVFIKEEQKHAAILMRFMKQEGIPSIKDHWTDSAFRKLRKFLSIENTITVLLTAEIIADVYYRGLRDATDSNTLKLICEQILSDEEMHINFQSYTLRNFYFKSSGIKRWAYKGYNAILMSGTALLVWFYHGHIFKRAGISFSAYTGMLKAEYIRARRMITGLNAIKIREAEGLEVEVPVAFAPTVY